jgi:uncharacterized protein (DUF488 family)
MSGMVNDTAAFSNLHVRTIGHSNLTYQEFLARLRRHAITAIADVRSSPYSRAFPHFDKKMLKAALKRDGLKYVFLGKELGGRPDSEGQYTGGVADYEKMAEAPEFIAGLERLRAGAAIYKVALMCSEGAPLECHRTLLIARALVKRGAEVTHIGRRGEEVPHSQIESDLLSGAGKDHDDMFAPREERLDVAYRRQAQRVAFSRRPKGHTSSEEVFW